MVKREDGNPLSPPAKRRKRVIKEARRAAERDERVSRDLLQTNPTLAPKKRPNRNAKASHANFEISKNRYMPSQYDADDDDFIEDEEIEEVKRLRIVFPRPNAVEVVDAALNSADPCCLTIVDGILAKRPDVAREIYSRDYRQKREAVHRYGFVERAFRSIGKQEVSESQPTHSIGKQEESDSNESEASEGEENPFKEEEKKREQSGLKAPSGKLTLLAPREHFEKWSKHFKGLEPEQVKFKLSVKITDDAAANKVAIHRFRMGLVAKFVNYAYFVDKYDNAGFPFLPNDLLLATTGIGFQSTKGMRSLQLVACQSWIIYRTLTNTTTPRELWTNEKQRETLQNKILARIEDPNIEETSAEMMFHRVWPHFKSGNKVLYKQNKTSEKEAKSKKIVKKAVKKPVPGKSSKRRTK